MSVAAAMCAAAARTLTAWATPPRWLAPGTPTPLAAIHNDNAAPLVNHVAAASYVLWPHWDATGWPAWRPSHLRPGEIREAHLRHVAAVLALPDGGGVCGCQAQLKGDIDAVEPWEEGVAV